MRWGLHDGLRPRDRGRARTRPRRSVLDLNLDRLESRVLLTDVSVLQYRYDQYNSGQDPNETVLTPSNVNPTDFGKLYSYPVDGAIYGEPLYMANLAIPGQATQDVVFVTTENDSVYAFNAEGAGGTTGRPIWQDSFTNPSAGITNVSAADGFSSATEEPFGGITATPVIDQATGAIYVVTDTKNNENGVEHIVQELHALNVTTGAEMFGGPVVIADTTVNSNGTYVYNSGPTVAGTGIGNVNGVDELNALTQFDRGALVLNNGVVYLTYSSEYDTPPSHGWILGYNAQTLQQTAQFCTTPYGTYGDLWGSGQTLVVDSQGDMYFVTGNGTFDTTLSASTGFPIDGDYGDSVVKIAADPTTTASNPNINGWGLKVLDYFTPSNEALLNSNDWDFGSGGITLLPATATGPQVVLAAGKQGTIFVVNTTTGMMGEFNANANNVYQQIPGQVPFLFGSAAYFNGSVYYGPRDDDFLAYQLNANNTLSTTPTSKLTEEFDYPGLNPVVSSDGSSDGIVWGIDSDAFGNAGTPAGPAILLAYNPSNLADVLYSSAASGNRDTAGNAVKFTVPLVDNGMVYVDGANSLTIYGELPEVVAPLAPTNLQATVSSGQVNLSWTNNALNATGITVERSTDGVHYTAVATLGPTATTYTDVGPFNPSIYIYEVVATNSAGSSPPSNTVVATPKPPTLAAGWTDGDIGGPTIPGLASSLNGVFTDEASGAGIGNGNTTDQFNFVYEPLTGAGSIVAQVEYVQYTNTSAMGGIMVRQSLDANSPFVDLVITPGGNADFQWRSAQGVASLGRRPGLRRGPTGSSWFEPAPSSPAMSRPTM